MSHSNGGWIHTFTATDTSLHKKGYTLYKITSIVFPRAIPEALTCITVWKRFDEVKSLYREICKRHKDCGVVPTPQDFSYFKRFEPKVIQSRKEYIIKLLYFITQHSSLYKSQPFLQFFLTPKNSPIKIQKKDNLANLNNHLTNPNGEDLISDNENEDNCENFDRVLVKESNKSNKHFSELLTSLTTFEGNHNDYIYEAAIYFSQAVQAEVNLQYNIAFDKYKHGVDLLSTGSKDDKNEDRNLIAKAKIVKYLTRANDIYNKYLLNSECNKKSNYQVSFDNADKSVESSEVYLERPWNHLSKFKVLRILETVMQVQNVTDKSIYIMKGIEKPAINCSIQMIFLPQNVPYMVQLVAFFQSDQKIFLLLRQAMGGKLLDYIRSYTPTTQLYDSIQDLFSDVDPDTNEETSTQDNQIENEKIVNPETLPSKDMNTNDLLNYSQNLLKSVTSTLNEFTKVTKELSNTRCLDQNISSLTPNYNFSIKHPPYVPEASVKQWARELIVAIHSLHSKGVIIRDLHTDNLMLGSKGQLLLTYIYQNEVADINFPIYYNNQIYEGHFIAPERPLSLKSDWWSFGVILFELLTGYSFKLCHPGKIDLYMKVQFPDVKISHPAKDILNRILQKDPDLRFDAEQIKSHKFFEETNWNEVAKNGVNSF